MDIFSTLVDICDMNPSVLIQPQDGRSIKPLFDGEIGPRDNPIPFRYDGGDALVNNDFGGPV